MGLNGLTQQHSGICNFCSPAVKENNPGSSQSRLCVALLQRLIPPVAGTQGESAEAREAGMNGFESKNPREVLGPRFTAGNKSKADNVVAASNTSAPEFLCRCVPRSVSGSPSSSSVSGVVEFGSVQSSRVASGKVISPKDTLARVFTQTRRAARWITSKRITGRLAGPEGRVTRINVSAQSSLLRPVALH